MIISDVDARLESREYSLLWFIRGGSAQKGYLFQALGIWRVGVLKMVGKTAVHAEIKIRAFENISKRLTELSINRVIQMKN